MTTYVPIKQNGTHQSMVHCNIQALLDMLQRSHKFHILILFVLQIRLNFLCIDNLKLVNYSIALNIRVIKYFTQGA